jgi:hypothetical protein
MNKNAGKYKDYIFVGNTPAGGDLSEFKNIKYMVGNLAYDIHGKEIDKNYMLPLFVAKESYNEYDRIMMAQLSAIRNS